MKPKLTIVLVLIVITPLAIVGWLGARIVQDEQVVLEHQLRELMLGQLRAVDTVLERALERYEQAVLGSCGERLSAQPGLGCILPQDRLFELQGIEFLMESLHRHESNIEQTGIG